MNKPAATVQAGSISSRDMYFSILIVGGLFFIFGFVTWINAILIPYFKIACELTNFQSYLVAFAFYISYFVMAIPSSLLLKRTGFKAGMMIGFFTMALGAFIFVPSALTRTYELFLMGLFTIGIGLAILQTAANPYITILGPKERAAQRFSIMGICNKAAGILAPLLLAAVILRATDNDMVAQLPGMTASQKDAALDEFIERVIPPYVIVGIVLVALGFLVRISPLPEINTDESDDSVETNTSRSRVVEIFRFPQLVLGAVAIFFHVGAQVIAVDTIVGYAGSMQLSLSEAKVFPSYTLFAQICGYLLGVTLIPKIITQVRALQCCTMLGVVFTFLIIYTHGHVRVLGHTTDISLWFVVLLGFANSMIWAGLWPLALDGVGRFIKTGAALMIMGLSGNAILPLVYGYYADHYDLRTAYWILLPCYLYLVFYATYGYRLRRWSMSLATTPTTPENASIDS
ncbi:sugar MFS transporter [Chryseolinea lacunae]|uniref:Sugar MFS transporter n=1 Tax=Chryseolinea lacunae TaxID=2801331 RepID=A0ABS1KU73_9BACT|nr:sugar MFS transporter [Chryseolinea lacunae]MBL0742980.1 sugar MFS transporter [Chryseolinea lacunae]